MARKIDPIKVRIDPGRLRFYIKDRGLTMHKIAKEGEFTAETISKGLRTCRMSYLLVAYLAERLNVSPNKFAYMSTYIRELQEFMNGRYRHYMALATKSDVEVKEDLSDLD